MNQSAQIVSTVVLTCWKCKRIARCCIQNFFVDVNQTWRKDTKEHSVEWASKCGLEISGSCESFTMKLTNSPCCPCSKQCSCRYCDSWVHHCTTQAPRSLPVLLESEEQTMHAGLKALACNWLLTDSKFYTYLACVRAPHEQQWELWYFKLTPSSTSSSRDWTSCSGFHICITSNFCQ